MEPRGGKVPAQTETERAVSQGHVSASRAADPDNLAGYRGIGVVASQGACSPGQGAEGAYGMRLRLRLGPKGLCITA